MPAANMMWQCRSMRYNVYKNSTMLQKIILRNARKRSTRITWRLLAKPTTFYKTNAWISSWSCTFSFSLFVRLLDTKADTLHIRNTKQRWLFELRMRSSKQAVLPPERQQQSRPWACSCDFKPYIIVKASIRHLLNAKKQQWERRWAKQMTNATVVWPMSRERILQPCLRSHSSPTTSKSFAGQ